MERIGFSRNHQAFIYSSLGLSALSGLAWLVSRYAIEGHDGWGDLALSSQYWALKVHGLGMMLTLVALGSAQGQLLLGLKHPRLRPMITAVMVIAVLVILSGYLIYYGPSGEWQDRISIAHWAFGLLACAALTYQVAARPPKALAKPKSKSRARRR